MYEVAQVGDTIILGGSFTSARNDDSSTTIARSNLLAFNASTGKISTTFVPNPNGAVRAIIPAGDGESVYVGGSFSRVAGQTVNNLVRIRVADGSLISNFEPGQITGAVRDLRLSAGKLWIAGAFTHVDGKPQSALATLNPDTGAFDPYMGLEIDGVHNGGYTAVIKMDINNDGTRLVGIGNFATLDGVKNHQMFMLDISGTSAQQADFHTDFYETRCSRSFDSYMRDLDFSPDGSFFVISTTGAYGGSTGACDQTARFETDSTGTNITPSWVDYTGGDTTYAVEITDSAVYVGGHQRWQNNAFAGDRAGQGAVSRPGIAALDPVNGLPFSWNPTRTRGVGVFDFLSTEQGLWVASDTDRIGDWAYRGRIALMPTNGKSVPEIVSSSLPNDIYLAGADSASTLVKRQYDPNGEATDDIEAPTGDQNWNLSRGSFMINGQVYTAWSDGSFTRRGFNGEEFGTSTPVDTADQLVVLQDWRNDISRMTGMSYHNGRIYFTQSNSNQLFYRYFTAESDVVGAKRFVASNNVSGIDFRDVRGMFVTDDHLYWATPDGTLNRIKWEHGPLASAPVANTAESVSGPDIDSHRWNGRDMFLYQDAEGAPAPQGLSASFTNSCDGMTCSFDASGSLAHGADITSYEWDFGDGTTDTGESVSHTYTDTGTYTATLTITDAQGRSAAATEDVHPSQTQVTHVGAESTNGNRVRHTVRIPEDVLEGDALLLAMTANNDSVTINAPNGWAELETVARSGVSLRLWSRTATAADAGSAIDVTTSGYVKADVTVAAYRGVGGTVAVDNSASTIMQSAATSHTTPEVSVTHPGSWVVSYWAEKSSSIATWTLPPEAPLRTNSTGSGGGKISAVLSDSDGTIPTGSGGEVTAATNISPARVGMISAVVTLERGTLPPMAAFTADCDELTCSFNATGSTADGADIATYEWNFGDGTTDTGETTSHTYAEAGTYTATLTITDTNDRTDTTTHEVHPARAVVAAFTADCDELTCSFNATGSTADGADIATYEWNFGDGTTDTGETTSHTYAEAGTYTATLTITDTNDRTDTTTHEVHLTQAEIAFVAAESANGNRVQHTVRTPLGVQEGDLLLLVIAANNESATFNAPSGWTELEAANEDGGALRLWTRTAAATDAGTNVTVATSAYAKADITIAAYRGIGGNAAVANSASSIMRPTSSAHVTPEVAVNQSGSWVVSYWAEKTSSTPTWTLPSEAPLRASSAGSGGGKISAVLSDSNGVVSTGTGGSLTATTDISIGRLITVSAVVRLG